MALVFIAGYAGIIFEEFFSFNKSGVGLVMAVSLWTIRSLASSENAGMELRAQVNDLSLLCCLIHESGVLHWLILASLVQKPCS